MSRILGIDLGTTNSVVAVFDEGRARVIPPCAGQHTTPSMVCFRDDGDPIVGHAARNMQVTQPEQTIYSIKRFMGRRHSEVHSEEKLVPYPVVGKPGEYVQVQVGKKKYTPQQISAMILRHLREAAESQMGEAFSRAVVTVPAYFNDAQRQATYEAGKLAGLKVERIINEPTAAALAYNVEQRGDRTVVVFDFGGGTFDLSLMRLYDGKFDVVAVAGNSHLGGDDFDQRIIDIVADDFLRRQCLDVRKDPMALQRLKQAAQEAKAELSIREQSTINLPFIAVDSSGPKHLEYTLGRSRFESVCADLFDNVAATCRQLLDEAGPYGTRVSDVIMVGGSSRIPHVQTMAKELFRVEKLDKTTNPDEVVSLGAALLGGVLNGDLHNVHLMDVTSHGFGVEAAGGKTQVLIPKNTPIPRTVKHVFTTPRDDATSVPINVLEGESQQAVENRPLGEFRLTKIPKAPAGTPRIEVAFAIDADGILKVSATDLDTKRSHEITVTGSGPRVSDAETERQAKEEELRQQDKETQEALVSLQNHAELTKGNVSQWLQHNHSFMKPREVDRLQQLLIKLDKRMQAKDWKRVHATLAKIETQMNLVRRKAG